MYGVTVVELGSAPQPRKQRTRAHVVGSLGALAVERAVVVAGYTAERTYYDYGTDLTMSTYDPDGYTETGDIPIQVKAHEQIQWSVTRPGTLSYSADPRDLDLWTKMLLFFVVAIYDVSEDTAYWVRVTVHTPKDRPLLFRKTRPLTPDALRSIRKSKNRIATKLLAARRAIR